LLKAGIQMAIFGKDGMMEEWNVEALAEIPLRREKNGKIRQ
jgi:hypothetical protein